MFSKLKSHFKKFDWILFLSAFLLCCFGLIEIYSIAVGQGASSFANFKKQALFVSLGIILMFLISFIDIYFLKSLRKYFYLAAVLILMAVLFFGSTFRGTTGWFNILGFGIQPVELVKVILILVLAGFFSSLSTRVKSFRHLLLSILLAFGLIVLILLQPDFGSAFILLSIWFFLLFFSGFNRKYIISIILLGVVVFSSLWLVFFQPYQKQRILTFLNLNQSSLEEGYNVSQAIIAVGSGGLTGRGVGFGSQSQLKFLPEAQNDFIFAVISEELGFLGVSLLLFFFLVFLSRLLLRVRKLKDDFAIYFVLGSLGLIFIQMFINIGMNIGIFPVVGISLPFVSYGGSAIISSFILLGLLQNIIIQSKIKY